MRLKTVNGAPGGDPHDGGRSVQLPQRSGLVEKSSPPLVRPFTVPQVGAPPPTTTSLMASNAATGGSRAGQLTAGVTPSDATGTVTFLDNGVP